MSTTKKIAHNTLVQMVGKILSTLLGLAGFSMMATYLGTLQFGWYTTAIYFLQFVGILTDFGTIPVTAQMLGEAKEKPDTLLNNIFTFRFITAFLCIGVAPLVVLLFPYAVEVKYAIAISALSFFSIALNQVFTGFFQYKLTMHIQAIGEVLGRVVLIAGLWFAIQGDLGFYPVMWVITIASFAYTGYLYLGARKIQPIRFAYNKAIWKRMIKKMWPIALSIMFNVVYLKGDVLLLSLVRDAHEVGIYGFAYRIIDIVAQTAMLLMGLFLPLLAYAHAHNKKELFGIRYQQAFDGMMMLCIPMVIGLIAVAKPLVLLIGGEAFLPAAAPLQLLAIAIFGLYLGAIFGHLAVAIDKQKQILWIYITTAILTLIGYLYFIPHYGMFGAAGMSIFSELLVGGLLFVIVRRFIPTTLHFTNVMKIFLSALVMIIPIILFRAIHIAGLISIAIVVYAAMLYVTGVLHKDLLKTFISRP